MFVSVLRVPIILSYYIMTIICRKEFHHFPHPTKISFRAYENFIPYLRKSCSVPTEFPLRPNGILFPFKGTNCPLLTKCHCNKNEVSIQQKSSIATKIQCQYVKNDSHTF